MGGRRRFLVGRRTRRGTLLVVCRPAVWLAGPWTVRAVVFLQ